VWQSTGTAAAAATCSCVYHPIGCLALLAQLISIHDRGLHTSNHAQALATTDAAKCTPDLSIGHKRVGDLSDAVLAVYVLGGVT
jgi:hypothetical protein